MVVKLLLQDPDIDINGKDAQGLTALFRACQEGHNDVILTLLGDRRVETNTQDTVRLAHHNTFPSADHACSLDGLY